MNLLTAELRRTLPRLYSQEREQDPMVHLKFFTPDSSWTWYATEGSLVDRHGRAIEPGSSTTPDDAEDFLFFGYVIGLAEEWGYFVLSELETSRGPLGLPIERDLFFQPGPFSQVIKTERHRANRNTPE